MNKYLIQYLTTNRNGGLEDREVFVKASSKAEAEAAFAKRFPNATITYTDAGL